jgi:ornithine cyclodeaminase
MEVTANYPMRAVDGNNGFRLRCASMNTMTSLPFISAERVGSALPYPALIEALRAAFAAPAQVPRRHAHDLSGAGTLLLMPSWQTGRQLGVKLVTVMPGNRERGLSTVHALYVLMDADTGVPLALMDGEQLTLRRTAAVSALASQTLSRPDSSTLLLVGSGRLAPEMAVAHCAARGITQVLVWGRDAAKVQAAMQRTRTAGLPREVMLAQAESLADGCARADIICCATTSTEPLLRAAWVRPGTHVDLVGGFRPDMREADDALMCSASLFVDTADGALAEAGDLVQPARAGLLPADALRAELAELAHGRHPGRRDAQEITLFKSVGSALADLAAAGLVWRELPQSVHG